MIAIDKGDNITGDSNANIIESGNDTLVGSSGDDTLDGWTGADILTGDGDLNDYDRGGSTVTNTFILRSGDGGNAITDADTITDFRNGTDVVGLDGGLQYSDLTIAQGTADNANDTIISITWTAEYPAIVEEISASDLNGFDIIPIEWIFWLDRLRHC